MAGVGGQTGCPTTRPAFRGFEPLLTHNSTTTVSRFGCQKCNIYKYINILYYVFKCTCLCVPVDRHYLMLAVSPTESAAGSNKRVFCLRKRVGKMPHVPPFSS